MNLTYTHTIHTGKLKAELEATGITVYPTVDAKVTGFSTSGTNAVLHVLDSLSQADQDTIAAVVSTHDATGIVYSWTGPDAAGSETVWCTGGVDSVTASRIRGSIAPGASYLDQLQEQLKYTRMAVAAQDVLNAREYHTAQEIAIALATLDVVRGFNVLVNAIRVQGAVFKAAHPELLQTSSAPIDVDPDPIPDYLVMSMEDLTAQVDGVATAFSTSIPYAPGTLRVYLGGLRLRLGDDYTESSPTTGQFTMNYAPAINQKLIVDRYKK